MELEYKRVGDVECITASGTPKEMASLVLELQERRRVTFSWGKDTQEDRRKLAGTIRDILREQVQVSSLWQQPCPTECTPNQGEEIPPGEPDQKSDTPQHP